MKVLAFAASSSRKSINKQLVTHAADLLKSEIISDAETEIIDINDFEMPLYSVDREAEIGIPELAHQFYRKIGEADALLISFAEHNGSYTAAFKNLYDWTSRIDMKVYQDKPVVMMATSIGPRGGGNVLRTTRESAPFFGARVVGDLSVPVFQDNFDPEKGQISNPEIHQKLLSALSGLVDGEKTGARATDKSRQAA